MGIKSMIKKAGGKAANTVNRLSALAPEQLEHIEIQREQYLSEMPDPRDYAAEELTSRLLAVCGVEIFNAYLPQLKELYVPVRRDAEYGGEEMDLAHNIRYFEITKWVTDKKENNLEQLINIYQVLSNEECNIALVFNRTCSGTKVYLAVVNTRNANNNVDVENYRKRLFDAIRGNCPGTELTEPRPGTLPCFSSDAKYSVATATNIPTEKSEKFISQTIEKLLDGIVPECRESEYTLVLLATPILDIEERKLHLANIYTALAPYASWQTQFTYTESDATNSMAMFGVNAGVSAGVQNGINSAATNTQGVTDTTGETTGTSESTGNTHSTGESTSTGKTESVNAGGSATISVSPAGLGGSATGFASTGRSTTDTISNTVSDAVSNSVTKSISKVTSRAVSGAKALTQGVSKATNLGANFGANFARASSVTATIGKNEGITQNYTNYNIKHALDILEDQMKRYEKGTALGMWDFAAYVLSEDLNVASNVAHSYIALTQGEDSYMSRSAINLWRGDMGADSGDAAEICNYIKELRHPVFGIHPGIIEVDDTLLTYPPLVTATTALSGKELAYSLNFPRKSVIGLPVLECAEFGRNIVTYDNNTNNETTIRIGKIFHMNSEETTPVLMSTKSLASHTFVTGSTGSGKSNTIYQILNQLSMNNTKFLVVEPAKGEYKHVFGNREDVSVYGTNPKISDMLKINPFSFNERIHVLEHIDRLVEIFNVCWPMYAAMPAVLKNAVEKSYEDCGWNLTYSRNSYGKSYYPTFADVTRNVKKIIDTSEYDAENKGAYKGSLLTRLQSLTNGINGQIFAKDELTSSELFEENVVVDLSRIGSTETKALIMGMIILKLQEYRISSENKLNSNLKHITVLEEAHNILKRTSIEQTSESANILGKSVEMISNAIAEMRSYGEGFIIADQSPGLLDMSVIRNTNTKIIMRLPDLTDRELVGSAANLNEDQIKELAKLPCGVGAVYQNEWIQPILCKVNHYKIDNCEFRYETSDVNSEERDYESRVLIAEILSKGKPVSETYLHDNIMPVLDKIKIDDSVKAAAVNMIANPAEKPRMTRLAPIFNALFPSVTDAVRQSYEETHEPSEWTNSAEEAVEKIGVNDISHQVVRDMIQCAMTYYLINEVDKVEELERWSKMGGLV